MEKVATGPCYISIPLQLSSRNLAPVIKPKHLLRDVLVRIFHGTHCAFHGTQL